MLIGKLGIATVAAGIFSLGFATGEEPAENLFHSGDGVYPRYRIPSLLVTNSGVILAICEGRKDGGGLTGNIDLVLRRSFDGGKTWSPQSVIVDAGDDTAGNQGAVIDQKTGVIWLAFTRSPGAELEIDITAGKTEASTRVFMTHSGDDGETWTEPGDITAAVKLANWTWYGCGPGTGIQLQSGRLLIPCYHAENPPHVTRRSHVIYSDNHGKTWQLGGNGGEGNGEPQAVEKRDGSVYLTARTSHGGPEKRSIMTSSDAGVSWSKKRYDESLYDSHCQASILAIPTAESEKPLWLYCHPAGPERHNLTIRMSRDEGETWKFYRLLRKGNAQYSSMAILPDGSIGCLYDIWEDGNYQLYFTRFPRP